MDRLGRVSFYTVFLAVNHLNVTRHQILDQDDDLCALVGFWWLPVERAVCILGGGVGEGRKEGRKKEEELKADGWMWWAVCTL